MVLVVTVLGSVAEVVGSLPNAANVTSCTVWKWITPFQKLSVMRDGKADAGNRGDRAGAVTETSSNASI